MISCNQNKETTSETEIKEMKLEEASFNGFPVKSGFKGDDWELEDCERAHEKNPESFEIPSKEEEKLVKEGHLLRLHFLTNSSSNDIPRAERMWVEVCQILKEGIFRGYLTNQPGYIQSLNPGDVIEFKWQHVAQVYVTKDDPRHKSNNEE